MGDPAIGKPGAFHSSNRFFVSLLPGICTVVAPQLHGQPDGWSEIVDVLSVVPIVVPRLLLISYLRRDSS